MDQITITDDDLFIWVLFPKTSSTSLMARFEPLLALVLYTQLGRESQHDGCIMTHLISFIAQSVIWRDTTSSIWSDIEERFSSRQYLSSLKQGEINFTNYLTELKILWDELNIFHPLPVCSCETKCSCSAFVNVLSIKLKIR